MTLFHQHINGEDILFAVEDVEAIPDSTERKGDVAALFKEEKLIGYNFFNLTDLVKIKECGLLVTPDDKLIDVLNDRLANLGFAKLDYVRSSGFKVGKVKSIEEHPLNEKLSIVTLDLGEKEVSTVTRYSNFKVGDLLVMTLDGAFRFDGTVFHSRVERNIPIDVELNSAADLHIGEAKFEAFIPEGYSAGDDFFLK